MTATLMTLVVCGVAVALEEVRVLLLRPAVVRRQRTTWFRASGISIVAQDAKLALVLVIAIFAVRLSSPSSADGAYLGMAVLIFVASAFHAPAGDAAAPECSPVLPASSGRCPECAYVTPTGTKDRPK